MYRFFALLALVLALAGNASSQTSSKAVVDVAAAGPSSPVAAGASFDANVTLSIKAGYHINAQKPSEDYLIGTSLKLTPPAGVTVAKTSYPAAKYESFSFSETPLAVYEGTAVIKVSLKLPANTPEGRLSVPGKLQFQACNDQQCLPPSTVDVVLEAEVGAPAASSKLILTGTPPNASVAVDGRRLGAANDQGRFESSELKPGAHRVRVEQNGFAPWEQNVMLDASSPRTIAVVATAIPATPEAASSTDPVASSAPTPPSTAPAPTPASSSRAPFLLGGIIAVVVGALGYFAVIRSGRAT